VYAIFCPNVQCPVIQRSTPRRSIPLDPLTDTTTRIDVQVCAKYTLSNAVLEAISETDVRFKEVDRLTKKELGRRRGRMRNDAMHNTDGRR
jgi:hypothetical protein